MLKKLTIKNFQAHKKRVISFDPYITTIIGPTDIGKSAITRAIRWVLTNRPRGDEFINHKAKKAEVTLQTDEHIITRAKGGTTNLYSVDGKEFHAFKTNVPKEVVDALKMDVINFQAQHDSPFWFGETAGEVSRQLNQIVNLGIIDDTLSTLKSKLRKSKTEVEVIEDRLEEAKKQKERLAYVPKMVAQYEVLEELLEQIEDKQSEIDQAEKLVQASERIYILDQRQGLYEVAIGEGIQLLETGERIKQMIDTKEACKRFKQLGRRLQAQKMDASGIKAMCEKIKKERAELKTINSIITSITQNEDKQCRVQKQIEEKEIELHELTEGNCPVCGKKMS